MYHPNGTLGGPSLAPVAGTARWRSSGKGSTKHRWRPTTALRAAAAFAAEENVAASTAEDTGVRTAEQRSDAMLRASAEAPEVQGGLSSTPAAQESSSPLGAAAVEVPAANASDVECAGRKRKLDEMHADEETSDSETAMLTGSGGTPGSGEQSYSDDDRCRGDEQQQAQDPAASCEEEHKVGAGVSAVRLSPELTPAPAERKEPVEMKPKAAGLEPGTGKEAGRDSHRSDGDAATVDAMNFEASATSKEKTKTQEAIAAVEQGNPRKTKYSHRRRKRGKEASPVRGISAASAQMLFQCSCQLLRSQSLDYQVRAREMEQRNAKQVLELKDWEKKICSLKRELNEYDDEARLDANGTEVACTSLVAASPWTSTTGSRVSGLEQKRPADCSSLFLGSSTAATTAVTTEREGEPLRAVMEATDPSLPLKVASTEAKLQKELQKRSEKLDQYRRSVPGFTDIVDDPHAPLL